MDRIVEADMLGEEMRFVFEVKKYGGIKGFIHVKRCVGVFDVQGGVVRKVSMSSSIWCF